MSQFDVENGLHACTNFDTVCCYTVIYYFYVFIAQHFIVFIVGCLRFIQAVIICAFVWLTNVLVSYHYICKINVLYYLDLILFVS